jgi:hypothetical protein
MRVFLTLLATTLYCLASAAFYFLEELGSRWILGPPSRFLQIAAVAFQPWLYLLDWLPYRIPFFVDWHSAPMASAIRVEFVSAMIWAFLVFRLRNFRLACYTIIAVITLAASLLIGFGLRDFGHARWLDEHYGSGAPPPQIKTHPVEEKPDYIKKLEEWDAKKP